MDQTCLLFAGPGPCPQLEDSVLYKYCLLFKKIEDSVWKYFSYEIPVISKYENTGISKFNE